MLRRAQVQLTQSQQTQIRNFINTNQLAEAQGIIIEALERKFSGAAKRMLTPEKALTSELETQLRLLGEQYRKLKPIKLTAEIVFASFQKGVLEELSKQLGSGLFGDVGAGLMSNPRATGKGAGQMAAGVGNFAFGQFIMQTLFGGNQIASQAFGGINSLYGRFSPFARERNRRAGLDRQQEEIDQRRKKKAEQVADDAERGRSKSEGYFDLLGLAKTVQQDLLANKADKTNDLLQQSIDVQREQLAVMETGDLVH